MKNSTNQHCC